MSYRNTASFGKRNEGRYTVTFARYSKRNGFTYAPELAEYKGAFDLLRKFKG